MGGMNLYGKQEKAIPGLLYGIESETESLAAGENIYPGDPVFSMIGDDKVCYGAHISAVSLTASADLVTGNSIAVKINGIDIAPVVFEDDSVTTIKKIINAIDQDQEVRALGIDAFFVEGSHRAIILQGPGVTITASATVTGGATQATFASTAYTSMKFMGVARFQQLGYGKDTGFYPAGSSVSVQTQGKVFVPVAENANPDDKKSAYVILSGDDAGKFTDVSTGNYDCGCFFRTNRFDGNLALIELRGMK
jgi:hypothetical protein